MRLKFGDRDSMKYNADGSLNIYIQNANPGADEVSNWLPAPKEALGVTRRLYAPKLKHSTDAETLHHASKGFMRMKSMVLRFSIDRESFGRYRRKFGRVGEASRAGANRPYQVSGRCS